MAQKLSIERLNAFIEESRNYYSWDIIMQNNDIDTGSDKGDQYEITCPFHEDKRPSLRLNKKLGVYHCFSCGRKGTYTRFLWELSGKTVPYSVYCEQILKSYPNMQRDLGFSSLFITESTIDSEFNKRRTFNPNEGITAMPYTVLSNKVRRIGDTWENLVLSLSLLQAGVKPEGVYSLINKSSLNINKTEERISLMDICDV